MRSGTAASVAPTTSPRSIHLPPKVFATTRASPRSRKASTRTSPKLSRIPRKFHLTVLCATNWTSFSFCRNFPDFLAVVQQVAPPPLAQAAAALAQKGPPAWQQAIENFWHGDLEMPLLALGEPDDDQSAGPEVSGQLLAWIFLQPYAEYLADQREPAHLDGTPSTCPLCGGKPIVGVLRPEGDGAKKSLVCMLCAHEWTFRRIYCPACGEEREPQMAFYSAPEIAHVRVDVCDTCHTYLKSIDLTKMGLAVPVVDELATIPLDLWAREHGYEKLQINLLGT